MRHFACFFTALFTAATLSATHIIGGSIYYTAHNDEDDIYFIHLEVLRDCYNGGPDTELDNPASIGVFDQNNNFIREFLVPLAWSGYLSVLDTNSVCEFTSFVCVQIGTYVVEVHLPAIPGGYTLAYQRCCRSMIIQNLENPLENGMTFQTHVDPNIKNSSPTFNSQFPYAVSVNTAFVYDASASDPDGDSLVYELTNPFFGATEDNPKPQPPFPPPYVPGAFKAPYTVENMLGGNYPLTLDPANGKMIAIPSTVGVFQIAYAVKEFRGGEHIGTTTREFTFVVAQGNTGEVYNISGALLDESQEPLGPGKVQLLERNISNDSFYVYAEVNTDTIGNYSFLNIPPGVFYLRATLDSSNAYFSQFLPTYYSPWQGVLFWYESVPLRQCDTSNLYRNIYMYRVYPPGGNGFLDGHVKNALRTGEPVAGLSLYLFHEEGFPLQLRITNEDGYFHFGPLSSGTYTIFADKINSSLHNQYPPEVELHGQKTIELFLYEDSLSLQMPTAIDHVEDQNITVITIFPNPASEEITIEVKDALDRELIYEMSDVYGKLIQKGSLFTNQLSTLSISDLPNGYYVVKFRGENVAGSTFFVKSQN